MRTTQHTGWIARDLLNYYQRNRIDATINESTNGVEVIGASLPSPVEMKSLFRTATPNEDGYDILVGHKKVEVRSINQINESIERSVDTRFTNRGEMYHWDSVDKGTLKMLRSVPLGEVDGLLRESLFADNMLLVLDARTPIFVPKKYRYVSVNIKGAVEFWERTPITKNGLFKGDRSSWNLAQTHGYYVHPSIAKPILGLDEEDFEMLVICIDPHLTRIDAAIRERLDRIIKINMRPINESLEEFGFPEVTREIVCGWSGDGNASKCTQSQKEAKSTTRTSM